MTEAEIAYKRAYSRGWNAGAGKRWPEHAPPVPPNELVAAVMLTAKALRDECDLQCATFGEDDDVVVSLAPRIDAFDAAMSAISEWLKRLTPDSAVPNVSHPENQQ